MAENDLEHALKAIDPVARAMLDLSIRRRLPDSSIADLAQMPPDELVRWRGEVLDQLGRQIGLTGPDARDQVRTRLEAIDPSAWVGTEQAVSKGKPKPKPKEKAKAAKPKPAGERPSRRLLGLLALLVVLVIIVAIISLSGGDDSGGGSSPTPTTPTSTSTSTTTKPTTTTTTTTTTKPTTSTTTTKPTTTTSTTTPPATPPVTMDPLPGMPDRGTATVSISGSGDKRNIDVVLKGMPAPGGGSGVYELWLYTTLIGARSLGTIDSGDGSISAPLPADASDFRYLDLSRESGPSDHIHSGISIRRAELAPLLAAADGN
jgi:Anti-sigma-K factor rskA